MKASKFTDAQKAFVIKQGEDGAPVAENFLTMIKLASMRLWLRAYESST